MALASAMMSAAVVVLVENFGWKPVPDKPRGRKTRLQRFCETVIVEMNRAGEMNLMRYADEVDKKYGVAFGLEDVNEEE